MNILPRTTRLAASKPPVGMVQDENKLPAGKVADKKAVKRSVLGDISNVTSKATLTTKAAVKPAEKAAVAAAAPTQAAAPGRVKIFNKVEGKAPAAVPAVKSLTSRALLRSDSAFANLDAMVKADEWDEEGKAELMQIDLADEPVEDIDANDRDDLTCCVEYVNEIFEYCHIKEVSDKVRPDYMTEQVDINEKMRAILVDWMVEVHVKFKLLTETMFLSVNIVDRFLSIKPITRQKLQLVGISAMLIASKYEEIYAPELRDFIHIADKAYSREEVLRMERLILTALDFNLSTSTPLHFLRRFSKASKSDSKTHTLSKYLSELTLAEYGMLKYLPSHIAASSVYIARCMTGRAPWSATLEKYAGLREEDIADCVHELNAVLKKTLQTGYKLEHSDKQPSGLICAVYKKYSHERLLSVAKIPAVDL